MQVKTLFLFQHKPKMYFLLFLMYFPKEIPKEKEHVRENPPVDY